MGLDNPKLNFLVCCIDNSHSPMFINTNEAQTVERAVEIAYDRWQIGSGGDCLDLKIQVFEGDELKKEVYHGR